mmetsp:Transcript_33645/g.85961  ORF Transcript_33645/g.85961 Transcript_33645/m.85961 type:complete len:318 (-) Transcript_33645:158-1111(-)|eukprot:jgi/Tetstr1/455471/TSEL_042300.t1
MATLLGAVIRAARPKFRGGHDRVAFAAHAFLLSKGLKLVAVGKAADEAAVNWTAGGQGAEEVGVEGWQELPEVYAFLYLREGDAPGAPVLLKCLTAGDKLLLQVAAVGGQEEPQLVEIDVGRHTTESADTLGGYADLEALAGRLEAGIKLPAGSGAGKAPAQEGPQQRQDREERQRQVEEQQARRGGDPLAVDDPLRAGPPRMGGGVGFTPPRIPGMGVGGGDLMPGGLMPPGRGGFGGGGMHMGPMDPGFSGGLRHPGDLGGAVPPGARYDPIGPPGMRGYNPEDFQRGQGRGFPMHPDLGPPPGMGGSDWDDMFG